MTIVDFTPNAPIATLPKEFREAILASQACAKTDWSGCDMTVHDARVGSLASGSGYCAQAPYSSMLYCACVNAPPSDPDSSTGMPVACYFGPCVNQTGAYKTAANMATLRNAAKECPDAINCIQVMNIGGAGNVISNLTQEQNCGSSPGIWSSIKAHPFITALAFILVIVLVMLTTDLQVLTFMDTGAAPEAPDTQARVYV